MSDELIDKNIEPEFMESDKSRAAKMTTTNTETMPDNTDNSETEKTPEELRMELQNEFNRLSELYKDAPDLDEQVKKSRISGLTTFGGSAERYDIKRQKERPEVIDADIEAICRHAFTVAADNIIIMDKGGRSFGSFIHEFLPIIRMEYSRISGKMLEEIKIPKILFLNPARGSLYDGLVPNEQLMEGKHNLIFEESTDHFYEYGIEWDKLDVSDQYKLFSGDWVSVNNVDDVDIYSEYHKLKEKERQGVRGMLNSVGKLIPDLSKKIPGAMFESHIGGSSWNGGVLGEFGLRPYVTDGGGNTARAFPGNIEYIRDVHGLAKAFAKRELDKIGRELGLVETEQETE